VEPEDLPGEILIAACRSFSQYISIRERACLRAELSR
jgi:hypothetical protein